MTTTKGPSVATSRPEPVPAPAPKQMRITTDDGIGLAVEVTGDGPGLLLVHGFGGAKEDFSDHVPALAADHTVAVFDHRGHGASDKPDDPAAYSLERLADDIVQVADALGFETFRLLGHSMGGMCARKVVIGMPERIDAFVMMDTCAGPIPGVDAELMDAAAEVALQQGKAALSELLDFAKPLETPAYQRVLAERPGYEEFVVRKFDDLSAVMWGSLAIALGHQSDDLPALANALACPLLVIVGEQDTPFVEASDQIVSAIASAELVVIPDAGHSPQFENPKVWGAAMTRFLSSISVAAQP